MHIGPARRVSSGGNGDVLADDCDLGEDDAAEAEEVVHGLLQDSGQRPVVHSPDEDAATGPGNLVDEVLRGQCPQRLAYRGLADPELPGERCFVWQPIATVQIPGKDGAAYLFLDLLPRPEHLAGGNACMSPLAWEIAGSGRASGMAVAPPGVQITVTSVQLDRVVGYPDGTLGAVSGHCAELVV